MQTLHYLTLAIILPPILAIFAEKSSLEFEGGAANVGMQGLSEWCHAIDYGYLLQGW